jgi:hypothetical protein
MKPGGARLVAATLTACVFANTSSATQLLSIQDFPLAKDEYVAGFDIKTFGVYALAICHIPHGWILSAGVDGTPFGVLTGVAGHGANSFDSASLDGLKQLFLVEDMEVDNKGDPEHPPTFKGRIRIGTYGLDAPLAWRPLHPSSYVLTPADRCP